MTRLNMLLLAGLTALLVALQAFAPETVALLAFKRAAIGSGEWWRLLSAHLVHMGWMHLLLNLLGLWVIMALFANALGTLTWLLALPPLALAVSTGLLFFNPRLDWYVGLSGVLHGLLVLGALASLRRDIWIGVIVLMLVSAKLAVEQIAGTDLSTARLIGGRVVVDAHLYGALGGLVLGLLLRRRI